MADQHTAELLLDQIVAFMKSVKRLDKAEAKGDGFACNDAGAACDVAARQFSAFLDKLIDARVEASLRVKTASRSEPAPVKENEPAASETTPIADPMHEPVVELVAQKLWESTCLDLSEAKTATGLLAEARLLRLDNQAPPEDDDTQIPTWDETPDEQGLTTFLHAQGFMHYGQCKTLTARLVKSGYVTFAKPKKRKAKTSKWWQAV